MRARLRSLSRLRAMLKGLTPVVRGQCTVCGHSRNLWAEKRIAAIPKAKRRGESYEALLGRLVQYLRSGQPKPAALKRLYESLDMVGQPANQMGKLAILTRDS